MTDTTLAELYRQACADYADYADTLAAVDVDDLIALAHGRLAGARRQLVIDAIARSPELAAAWRVARDSSDWATAVAADLAADRRDERTSHRLPGQPSARPSHRPVARLRGARWSMAAAVSGLAVAAAFLAQPWQQPGGQGEAAIAGHHGADTTQVDAILSTSFDRRHRAADPDVIFSARLPSMHEDGIFDGGFGNGGI